MVALYTVWYNFARINSAIRVAPAMAAGLSSRFWEMVDLVKLIDDAAPIATNHGPYKKQISNWDSTDLSGGWPRGNETLYFYKD